MKEIKWAIDKATIERANKKIIQSSKLGISLPCKEKTEREIKEAFSVASMGMSVVK